MEASSLHRFEQGGRRFVLDMETCFCFECDEVSWAVMEHYPHMPVNRILHKIGASHPVKEVEEVIGELEWLRSTKSILPNMGPAERLKHYQTPQELREVDVQLPTLLDASTNAPLPGAMAMLLGRSGSQKEICLRIHYAALPHQTSALTALLERAFGDARLADKNLSVELVVALAESKPLAGHQVSVVVVMGDGVDVTRALTEVAACGGKLSRFVQIANVPSGLSTGVVLVPGSSSVMEGVKYLNGLGFKRIDLDMPAAYRATLSPDPAAMLPGLEAVAVYYAQELLRGNYFRLEPIAATFRQIYEGVPRARSDGSGSLSLAIDSRGDIYPSRYFWSLPAFRVGNVGVGQIDETLRGPFDDLGVHTTPPCIRCWARNLCGGGHSAIHHVLSGAIRTPDADWCERQREWFGAAIAAFNILSAQGVNFARLYQNLEPRKKLSLWQAARTAMTMKVGVRPIEESDAALLTRWENWSGATYFLGNEYGMLLATCYDREMDSLHPRGIEQELMIVSRRNEPIGLLKIRPDTRLGVARVWFFLADPTGYGDSGLRKSFGYILKEAAGQAAFSTLVAAAGPGDPGLGDFLEKLGFHHAGTERQALFLHDAYHDIQVYTLRM